MGKNNDVDNYLNPFEIYVGKVKSLKDLLNSGRVINCEKYRKQLAEIENDVRAQLRAGRGANIDFDGYSNQIDEIISHADIECEEYQTNKQNALMDVLSKNDQLLKEKKKIDKKLRNQATRIRNLRVNLVKVASVVAAFTLLPFATGALGAFIGSKAPKSKDYKKIEKSYDAKTDKLISSNATEYDAEEYDYKTIIKVCTPWEKDEVVDGYKRDVVEYEYTRKYDDKVINIDQIIKDCVVINYTETKFSLDKDDSTDQKEVIITEITHDKSDYKINDLGHVAMFMCGFMGLFLGSIPFMESSYRKYDYNDLKNAIKELRKAKIMQKRS